MVTLSLSPPHRRTRLPFLLLLTAALGATGCSSTTTANSTQATATSTAEATLTAEQAPANQRPLLAPTNWKVPTVEFASRTEPQAAPESANAADAVEQFVAAEARGDFATSYSLLASTDRAPFGSVERWRSEHRNLPQLVSFAASKGATTGGVVKGTLRLQPELTEVKGLVPAVAEVTWEAISEAGGWRVRGAPTTMVPQFPAVAIATADVSRWLAARQSCSAAPAGLEYSGGFAGVAGYADRLCGAAGVVSVQGTSGLDAPDELGPIVAAYGAEAARWARVVAVTSPLAFRAVVAPVGEHWSVIGLLAPATKT